MAADNDEEYDKDLDDIAETESDKDFEKFKKISAHDAYQVSISYSNYLKPILYTKTNPLYNRLQVVRYERGGKPLWTTKHGKLTEDKIPKCEHCGSKRIFEFQVNYQTNKQRLIISIIDLMAAFKVTPQLLCYLNLDESKQSNSIDWAGLYAFTCSKSCKAANDGYSNEFIYKQDFISK